MFFLLGSIGFVALSWRSLKDLRSHGFYRFFAFEGLWGIILLNSRNWFEEPLSSRQMVSWVFLLASIGMALYGFILLKRIGQPEGAVENTTQLVTGGLYRFIRHPLYASLLLFGWGAFLKHISAWSSFLVFLVTVFLYATARVEERENLDKFGPAYEAYMQTSRMFIPFLF